VESSFAFWELVWFLIQALTQCGEAMNLRQPIRSPAVPLFAQYRGFYFAHIPLQQD